MLHLFKQKQNKTHIKKSQWFYKMEIFAGAKEAVEADGGLARRLKAYTHTHAQVRGLAVWLNWGWLYSRHRLVFVPKLCLNIEADRSEKSRLSRGFNPICIFITIN